MLLPLAPFAPARLRLRRQPRSAPRAAAADEDADWFTSNEGTIREAPILLGAASIAALLANRLLSGGGGVLVSDASSAQSRADVVVLSLATAALLTGLQWKSVVTRAPTVVLLDGVPLDYAHPALPPAAAAELRWAWSAVQATTRAGSLAVFYRGRRALQAGCAPSGACAAPDAPPLGAIAAQAMGTGVGQYLANTALYPGRVEFAPYLPLNAQGILVQPLGSDGVLCLATGTQRGFSARDQRWLAVLAQKLDQTLDGALPAAV